MSSVAQWIRDSRGKHHRTLKNDPIAMPRRAQSTQQPFQRAARQQNSERLHAKSDLRLDTLAAYLFRFRRPSAASGII
jgi:hypothetical protein